jgi:transposase
MKKNTSKQQMAAQSLGMESRTGIAFYIGIDLGDKTSEGCTLGPDGEVVERFRLPMQAAEVEARFAKLARSRIAIEAGGQSRWIAEMLEEYGHEVYVSNTRKVPYIHESDSKNDPGDAYKLAELVYLKPRLLHPIQHRSRQQQQDLALIRAREALVESRTRLINAVRGLSKSFGVRLGKCSAEAFTTKQADQVAEAAREAVAPLLASIDDLNERIRYYDAMIEHTARTRYAKYWLLDQVNGVGAHTALAYMLTIGEAERFDKSRMVGAYLGLRPKQQDSGARKPQLGITKAGDGYLRKLLVNCAHYILGAHGKDSDLRRFGLRLCERGGKNGKKRAVVAVARKLAVLLHRLWVTGEVYEPLRNHKQPVEGKTAA